MKVIVPPIKSQGIKTKLVPTIASIIPEFEGRWIEPFLGTGVVAFNMNPESAVLNDINPHIIRFYKSIQEGIITKYSVREYLQISGEKLAASGDNGYDYFREVRDRFNEYHDPLDFLFLSRAGFNGMMRFNKKGHWNVPFCKKPGRFSKSYITKIVNQVDAVSKVIKPQWEFSCVSFEAIIKDARQGDIVYCDPPYFGRYTDYFNSWTEENENKLQQLLLTTKAKFILSTWYGNSHRMNPMIDRVWKRFNITTKEHFYHSGGKIENRNSMVEALVFNYDAPARPIMAEKQIRRRDVSQCEQLTIFEHLDSVTAELRG